MLTISTSNISRKPKTALVVPVLFGWIEMTQSLWQIKIGFLNQSELFNYGPISILRLHSSVISQWATATPMWWRLGLSRWNYWTPTHVSCMTTLCATPRGCRPHCLTSCLSATLSTLGRSTFLLLLQVSAAAGCDCLWVWRRMSLKKSICAEQILPWLQQIIQ